MWLLVSLALLALVRPSVHTLSASTPAADAARSPINELHTLLDAGAQHFSDPQVLLTLAALYLDLGDEVETEPAKRKAAYEEGAHLAKRALAVREADPDAHYLYAANLGSAMQLAGVMASALTVRELKAHVTRALELRRRHAPSLHMMGMMLEELPWMLGGDAKAALAYLQEAVAVDPLYDHARLDLAKAYIKRKAWELARRELHTLLDRPPQARSRYHAEATALLSTIDERGERRR